MLPSLSISDPPALDGHGLDSVAKLTMMPLRHFQPINNMNKDNAAQYLPLVQALAEGKTIQYKANGDDWEDSLDPLFADDPEYYRIKPEPREWDAYTKGGLATFVNMSHMEEWEKIRVREILD